MIFFRLFLLFYFTWCMLKNVCCVPCTDYYIFEFRTMFRYLKKYNKKFLHLESTGCFVYRTMFVVPRCFVGERFVTVNWRTQRDTASNEQKKLFLNFHAFIVHNARLMRVWFRTFSRSIRKWARFWSSLPRNWIHKF